MFAPDEEDVFGEGGVIADLDLETDGESEAGSDLAEVVVTGFEHDAMDVGSGAEVDLHPLHGLLGWGDGAVVAVIGFCVRVGAAF